MKQKNSISLFLKKTLVFLSPVIFVLIFFEVNLSQVQNSVSKKRNVFTRNTDTQAIILGASHANHGINPEFFSIKAVNLANIAQDFYYDRFITKKVFEMTSDVDLVIVTLTYFSFDYRIIDRPDFWRSFFYTHAWNINNEKPSLLFDPRSYSLLALYEPTRALGYLKNFFDVDLAKDIKPNGWSRSNAGAFDLSDNAGKNLAAQQQSTLSRDNRKENKRHIETIVTTAQKHNAHVILITPPVFQSYSDNIDLETFAYMQKAVQEISKKYTVPYYNYFTDARFSSEDFTDVDHLNSKGAEKFSIIIDTEIIQPLLETR